MRITERAVVSLSWAVMTALGSAFIAGYWLARGATDAALSRVVLFAAIIACVHVIGYQAYKHQGDHGDRSSTRLAPQYKPAVKSALLQQAILLVLAALVLDGGGVLHATLVAVFAYWLSFVLLVVRRPSAPTSGDILLVRYGFLLVFLVVITVGPIVWTALGRW